MIWAARRGIFNQSSVAAIRFYSATNLHHIAFSGVSTSIRLPWPVVLVFSLFPVAQCPVKGTDSKFKQDLSVIDSQSLSSFSFIGWSGLVSCWLEKCFLK
jgi:hypothetical protein